MLGPGCRWCANSFCSGKLTAFLVLEDFGGRWKRLLRYVREGREVLETVWALS